MLPRPSQYLQRVTGFFPKFWRQFEDFRRGRGVDLPEWPQWCYCPLAASYAIVSGGGDNRLSADTVGAVSVLGCLAAWRPGKGIYRFDPDLFRALWDTPITGDIPVDVLLRLPEWCVYVELPETNIDNRLFGFFAFLEFDVNYRRTELRIMLDVGEPPQLASIILHVDAGSIDAAISEAALEGARYAHIPHFDLQYKIYTDFATKYAAPILSLLLYLCSDDVSYSQPTPPSIPVERRTHKGMRLFAVPAPVVWDVGARIGAAIRDAQTSAPSVDAGSSHRSPVAHLRRAHWHTYWTGKGRKTPRVKWLSPILVGAGDTVATLHKVGLPQ